LGLWEKCGNEVLKKCGNEVLKKCGKVKSVGGG
jgi:hypothetical protein